MELVALARFLTHHRLMVALGVVLAVAAGVAAASRVDGTAARTGIASGRVLIDQNPSLVADLRGKGPQTIGTRAVLFGDLLATDGGRAEIARAAGVPVAQLAVVIPSMSGPITAVPLPAKAAESAALAQNAQPYGVTVLSDSSVPILTIAARAPTVGAATRLVDGATATLRTLIAQRTIDTDHGVVAEPVGAPRARLAPAPSRVPPRAVAPVAALFVFLLWCGGLIVISGAARAWRGTAAPDPAP